jgi:iron(III) transport system ATP-binding protein
MKTVLELNNISKSFGDQPVVKNLSLTLDKGMIGCLLGPSGCGKTTILRVIAGFEGIDAGEIRINQSIVSGRHILVPPEQRRIGMVFQDYALFPHLSVRDNVAFGLRNINGRKKEKRIDELLHLVRLVDAAQQYPHEISGGQQQRVIPP